MPITPLVACMCRQFSKAGRLGSVCDEIDRHLSSRYAHEVFILRSINYDLLDDVKATYEDPNIGWKVSSEIKERRHLSPYDNLPIHYAELRFTPVYPGGIETNEQN